MKLVTSSDHKAREWQALMEIDVVSLDLVGIQGSMIGVVKDKAMKAHARLKEPCVVDNVSLCFGNTVLPGPYIRDFETRLDKDQLVKMAQVFGGHASLYCHIGYHDGRQVHVFEGQVDGTIVESRGWRMAGFDSIFEVDGHTVAEMYWDQERRVSHRAKAIREFLKYLNKK